MEPDIVCRSSSPTPLLISPDEGGGSVVCALCLSAPGKYTCPRCNAPYCSLPCYKGARHCACAELFYRDSVLQALQEQGGGGRREMEELLLKLRGEDEEPQGGAAGGGLWGSLSPQEKEHFTRLLVSGHIGALLPHWTPWWDMSQGCTITELPGAEQDLCHGAPLPTCATNPQTCGTATPLSHYSPGQTNTDATVISPPEKADDAQKMAQRVADEGKDSTTIPTKSFNDICPSAKLGHRKTNVQDFPVEDTPEGEPRMDDKAVVSQVPPLLRSIPPLNQLTRKPSPLVGFTLVNVIYSYSFSLIRHNGDLSDDDDMLDFIGTLLSVSGALSTTTVYNSTSHALKSAVRAATDPLSGGDEGGAVLAMEATAKILLGDGGTRYSLAALSHLYRLLGMIRKVVIEEKDVRKGAFNAKKKSLFLAAWVNENGHRLAILSAEVMMEYKQYLKEINQMAELSQGLQQIWGGKRPPAKKKLIEEVN